jgi:hypothetical protein
MLDFYQPHWPLALWQQHMGVMRTYGRIDTGGRIYVLAPPSDGEQPHEIRQPDGFRSDHKRPNQSIEPAASRRAIQLSMSSNRQSEPTRVPGRGGSSCSR